MEVGEKTIDKFSGVYSALLTPFDNEGRPETEVLQALIDFQLSHGLRGCFTCGSMGEGILMSEAERRRVAEAAVEALKGRAISIVHVGHASSDISAELAEHAQSIGADAVGSVPPYYYPAGPDQIVRHYRTIASRCSLPLLVYSLPMLAGSPVTLEGWKALFEIPTAIGMKFTGYDLYQMRNVYELMGQRILVFSGSDEVALPALVMGSHGSIGSTQNVLPEKWVAIRQAFLAGDWERAQRIQYQVNRLIRLLLSFGHNAWKEAARVRGFDCGPSRAPLRSLSEEEAAQVHQAMEEALVSEPEEASCK